MKRASVCLILAALASTFACSATTQEEGSSDDAVTTFAKNKPQWTGPAPGTKNNDIDGKLVFDAWRKVKEDFYDNKGLKTFDRQGNLIDFQGQYPLAGEAAQCMGNYVPNWSDLAMHFYCWMPSYAEVTPNVRGCFSNLARALHGPQVPPGQTAAAGFEQRVIFYPEIYDYCLYQEYDYVKLLRMGKPTPVFDTAEIDANKAAGKKIGVMKWVDDNIAAAFKHVMFTWYEPLTYKLDQQQAIINAFYNVDLGGKLSYGPNDTAQVNACRAKRPTRNMDPSDGTHCSSTKVIALTPHSYYPAALAYMQSDVITNTSYTKTEAPPPPPVVENELKSALTGKCADVDGVGPYDGARVQQWSCSGGDNQTWRIQEQSPGKFTIAAKHSGKCLDVAGGTSADGAGIHQWACGTAPTQLWRFENAGNGAPNGVVHVVNASTGKCLDLPNGNPADGAMLQQWSCPSAGTRVPSMEWKRD